MHGQHLSNTFISEVILNFVANFMSKIKRRKRFFYIPAGKDGVLFFHSLSPQREETYYANVSSLCQDPRDGVEMIILIFPSLGRPEKERKKWGGKEGMKAGKRKNIITHFVFPSKILRPQVQRSGVLVILGYFYFFSGNKGQGRQRI